VDHISKLVSEMAVGTAEQSTGIGEINIGVTQLDQVTQQNAAMVEEATAASHLLNTDATKLSKLVSQFHIGDTSSHQSFAAHPVDIASPVVQEMDWEVEPEDTPHKKAANDDAGAANMWQDF